MAVEREYLWPRPKNVGRDAQTKSEFEGLVEETLRRSPLKDGEERYVSGATWGFLAGCWFFPEKPNLGVIVLNMELYKDDGRVIARERAGC